jgi:hypothetical protein
MCDDIYTCAAKRDSVHAFTITWLMKLINHKRFFCNFTKVLGATQKFMQMWCSLNCSDVTNTINSSFTTRNLYVTIR